MPKITKDKKILNKENNVSKIMKKSQENITPNVSTIYKNIKILFSKNKKNIKKIYVSKKGVSTKVRNISKKSSYLKTHSLNKTKKHKNFLVEFYDLPYTYNKTLVKILAQTPNTLFVYWEISNDDKNYFIQKYGENFFETTTPILKVHNKTKNYTFEIQINDFANCWYLHVNDSKCVYKIELDRKFNNQNTQKQYVYISSSNDIEIPNDHILFKQDLSNVQFKDVKTNKIINVDINKSISKIYNIENLYKFLYSKEELTNFKNLSNPSSGNPTSTFK